MIARHRLDLLVADRVIVEVKSAPVLLPASERQLRNYLSATRLAVGLLLNFGIKPQFSRVFRSGGNRGSVGSRGHPTDRLDPPDPK